MAGIHGKDSYERLIRDIYTVKTGGFVINYQEYKTNIRSEQIMVQNIISSLRSGYYRSNEGYSSSRGSLGDYWEKGSSTISNEYASNLRYYETQFNLYRLYDNKGSGQSVRCGDK